MMPSELTGLILRRSELDAVGEATKAKGSREGAGDGVSGHRVVSADVLASTRTSECRCEDPIHMAARGLPPLHAGTPIRGAGGLRGISPEFNFTTDRWEAVPGGESLGAGCN